MKRSVLVFPFVFLIVEVATSWFVWSSQPSHGLVDLYGFSFVNYERQRLLPWVVIVTVVVGVVWLMSILRRPTKEQARRN